MNIVKILAAVVLLLLVSIVFFYSFQERLIFLGEPITEDRAKIIGQEFPEAEEVTINASDGVKLHGWYVDNSNEKEAPLVIYFGGNNQEVSGMLSLADNFEGWGLLLMNYRGYGLSEGTPGQEKIFKDALLIYDSFKRKDNIDSNRIVVMGWSLGSGAAVYLAEKRNVNGVILVSPYDNLKSIAAGNISFLSTPIDLLLKHPFDSISRAPRIDVSALAIAGSEDDVVPPDHSERLMKEWGGEYCLKIIEGKNHTNIHYSDEYWQHIREYLSKIED